MVNKKIVLIFDKTLAERDEGEPYRRFVEALEALKKRAKYKKLLKNITVDEADPSDIVARAEKAAEKSDKVFLFAGIAEGEAPEAGADWNKIQMVYIKEQDSFDGFYPLAEIVTIVLGEYIAQAMIKEGRSEILDAFQEILVLKDINVESVVKDKNLLVFTLIPNAEAMDKEGLIKKYACLKRFMKAV
jgi:hypothetical protein